MKFINVCKWDQKELKGAWLRAAAIESLEDVSPRDPLLKLHVRREGELELPFTLITMASGVQHLVNHEATAVLESLAETEGFSALEDVGDVR
jgi:hypothetical protein